MNLKLTLSAISIATALALTGCGSDSSSSTPSFTQVKDLSASEKTTKIKTTLTAYADLAGSSYDKALADAKAMKTAIATFNATPTEATLTKAKEAWLQSRESYGVTEAFRLSCGPIDGSGECADGTAKDKAFVDSFGAPEGQLNAWPLDENMIDYTSDTNGKIAGANIINTAGAFTPTGGTEVDATTINKTTIASLNENGGDANVATGYHAIEFLLWGQDQDYTSQLADNITHGALKAGERPLTDYTTDANKDRRKAYLTATADLIVDDLTLVTTAWSGTYKKALIGEGANKIDQTVALKNIFVGMTNFLGVELANERIHVAKSNESEEDEHSCFSDNTHRDIDLNYVGFKNIMDKAFIPNISTALKTEISTQVTSIDAKVAKMNSVAKNTAHFDYQIVEGNNAENYKNITDTVTEMKKLSKVMTKVASEYGVAIN